MGRCYRFKSNEPALNFILPILNEGYYYNDGVQMKAARRLVIAASNEVPETEDLSAFFDRFIFRHYVDYVKDPNARVQMARTARDMSNPRVKSGKITTKITLEEIDAMQKVVRTVDFSQTIEADYDKLYRALSQAGVSVSDRRYNKGQLAMQANALLNGRLDVNHDDFAALTFILSNTKDQIAIVDNEVSKYKNPFESAVKDMHRKAKEAFDTVMALSSNKVQQSGEAVTASAALNTIITEMESEVKSARKNGYDTKPLEKMVTAVEGMISKIESEVLKNGNREKRTW